MVHRITKQDLQNLFHQSQCRCDCSAKAIETLLSLERNLLPIEIQCDYLLVKGCILFKTCSTIKDFEYANSLLNEFFNISQRNKGYISPLYYKNAANLKWKLSQLYLDKFDSLEVLTEAIKVIKKGIRKYPNNPKLHKLLSKINHSKPDYLTSYSK